MTPEERAHEIMSHPADVLHGAITAAMEGERMVAEEMIRQAVDTERGACADLAEDLICLQKASTIPEAIRQRLSLERSNDG